MNGSECPYTRNVLAKKLRSIAVILAQTLAMIVGWLLLWLYLSAQFHMSVVFFSAGLCFILPIHAIRWGCVMRRQ